MGFGFWVLLDFWVFEFCLVFWVFGGILEVLLGFSGKSIRSIDFFRKV